MRLFMPVWEPKVDETLLVGEVQHWLEEVRVTYSAIRAEAESISKREVEGD